MCQQSIESGTDESFDLVDIWFKGLTESEGTIKDPFAIISDQSGGKSGPSSDSADKRPTLNKDCEGEKKVTAQPDTKRVTFGDAPANQVSAVSEVLNFLRLPSMVNLYESGLRISPRLQELAAKKRSEELHPAAKKSSFVTKCILGLFTIFSTVESDAIHVPLPSTATN